MAIACLQNLLEGLRSRLLAGWVARIIKDCWINVSISRVAHHWYSQVVLRGDLLYHVEVLTQSIQRDRYVLHLAGWSEVLNGKEGRRPNLVEIFCFFLVRGNIYLSRTQRLQNFHDLFQIGFVDIYDERRFHFVQVLTELRVDCLNGFLVHEFEEGRHDGGPSELGGDLADGVPPIESDEQAFGRDRREGNDFEIRFGNHPQRSFASDEEVQKVISCPILWQRFAEFRDFPVWENNSD